MYRLIHYAGNRMIGAWIFASVAVAPVYGQELTDAGMEGSPLIEVNWIEEILQGGITMICLGVLSVALGAFLIERFLTLRRKNFFPLGLITGVRRFVAEHKYEQALELCMERKSVMADILAHCVKQRDSELDHLAAGVADIGERAISDQEERCAPLSVIAGVAPLLGLLGTMIGMIEAFKLVEIFGDEGGASLLAGSISKALITTAVGLVLAIPAIIGFHWSRRQVHQIANRLEVETEDFLEFCVQHQEESFEKQLGIAISEP